MKDKNRYFSKSLFDGQEDERPERLKREQESEEKNENKKSDANGIRAVGKEGM